MALKPLFARAPLMDTKKAALPLGQITLGGEIKAKIAALAQEVQAGEKAPSAIRALTVAALLLKDKPLIAYCEKEVAGSPLFLGEDMPVENALNIAQAALALYEQNMEKAYLEPVMRLIKQLLHTESAYVLQNPGEAAEVILRLYNLTGKRALLDIMTDLRQRAMDWTSLLHTFEIVKPFERMVDMKAMEANEGGMADYYLRQKALGHGVSVARNLKTPALYALFSGSAKETEAPMAGYRRLMKYHGVAGGIFTAAPYLSGQNFKMPTSYEAMGELAYSLSVIARVDETALEALEKVAQNGLMSYRGGAYHSVNEQKDESKSTPAAVLKGLTAYVLAANAILEDSTVLIELMMSGEIKVKTAESAVKIAKTLVDGAFTLEVSAGKETRQKIAIRVPEWAGEAYGQIAREAGVLKDEKGMIVIEHAFAKAPTAIEVKLFPKLKAVEGYRQSRYFEYGPYVLAKTRGSVKSGISAEVFGKAETLVPYKDAEERVAQFEAL